MRIYCASKIGPMPDPQPLVGTTKFLADQFKVSRQYLHRMVKDHGTVKGYVVQYSHTTVPKKHQSVRNRLQEATELLKRARLIIDEENSNMADRGEYSNVGIVDDIDRFLKEK